jgi:hypothetical protein
MIRGICLPVAALVMLAAPAFSAAAPGAACKEPVSPTMPDGKTVPASEIIKAANAVKAFVAESDLYQQCLKDVVEKLDIAATVSKTPVDPKVKAELEQKGDDNQLKKEQLGAAYSATAAAYRAAHPPAAKK